MRVLHNARAHTSSREMDKRRPVGAAGGIRRVKFPWPCDMCRAVVRDTRAKTLRALRALFIIYILYNAAYHAIWYRYTSYMPSC